MRRLIKAATRAVYTEQFDFDFDKCVTLLSRSDHSAKRIRAYVAIIVATGLDEPLSECDVDEAAGLVERYSEGFASNPSETSQALCRAEAKLALHRFRMDIAIKQLVSESRPYSYEGAVYRAEKTKRGPLSASEKATFRVLTDDVQRLEREIAEQKAEDADLQAAAQRVLDEWREKYDEEIRKEGPRSPESLASERAEIIATIGKLMRENKLNKPDSGNDQDVQER